MGQASLPIPLSSGQNMVCLTIISWPYNLRGKKRERKGQFPIKE
jgi:hypothetical protein